MQRLEQVRLADTVPADDENDAGRELQVERRVRPKVTKLNSGDVQPASLIGMIRYT
jgi:hypothetical protein